MAQRLRTAGKRALAGWNELEKTGASWEDARGWENTEEAKRRGEKTPLRPLLEENEVCVIQATGRCGVNPAGFLLGTLLL